jgi:hypothetical protein
MKVQQFTRQCPEQKKHQKGIFRSLMSLLLIVLIGLMCGPQIVRAQNTNSFSFLGQQTVNPRPSPFGWSVFVGSEQDVWWNQASTIANYSTQSGAGWVRDVFLLGNKIQSLSSYSIPNSTPISVKDKNGVAVTIYMPNDFVTNYVNQLKPFLDTRHNLVLAWVGGYSTNVTTIHGNVVRGAWGAVSAELIKAINNARPATNPGEIVIEMGNEPNEFLLNVASATPADVYVNGVKEMANAIRAVSPNTKVIATLCHFGIDYTTNPYEPFGYLKKILDLGVLSYVQGFAAHPYRGTESPEAAYTLMNRVQVYSRKPNLPLEATKLPLPTDQGGFISEISQFTALIKKYNTTNKALDLHFTEIGYASLPLTTGFYAACDTELRQAAYLTRLLTQIFQIRVLDQAGAAGTILNGMKLRSVEWYNLKENVVPSGTPAGEGAFGVITTDLGRIKPAFKGFSAVANFLGGSSNFSSWGGQYSVSAVPGQNSGLIVSSATPPTFSTIMSYGWKTSTAVIIPFWTATRKDYDVAGKILVTINANSAPVSGDKGFARVTLVDPSRAEPYRVGYTWNAITSQIEVPVRLTNRVMFLVMETSQAAAEAYIKENFLEFYGATPSSSGLSYWSDVLLAGQMTVEAVRSYSLSVAGATSSALASREKAFVTDLFNLHYGIDPDATTLQYWVDRLTIGSGTIPAQSRDMIKNQIIQNDARHESASTNVTDLMMEFYGQTTSSGLSYWTDRIINQGASVNDVRTNFLTGASVNDPALRSREDSFMGTVVAICNWGDWTALKAADPNLLGYWMSVLITGTGGNPPKSQDTILAENGRR